MSSRSLRSRSSEVGRGKTDLSAGECVDASPTDESVGLGSVGSNIETPDPVPHEIADNEESGPVTQSSASVELLLKNFMAVIQEGNRTLQESIKSDINSIKSEISSVRSDVREEINSVRAELNTNSERLEQFRANISAEIASIRTDVKAETDRLIKNCERKNEELRKEIESNLDSEARRITNLVGQAKREFQSELLAAKEQMDEGQEKLSSAISTLSKEVNDRFTQQKESTDNAISQEKSVLEDKFGEIQAKFVALENKISEMPRTAVVVEPQATSDTTQPPSAVDQIDQRAGGYRNLGQVDEDRPCPCETNNCTVCMSMNGNDRSMNGNVSQVSTFLSTNELPLPTFDECKEVNPVYFLRQLDEFMKLKGIPRALQLPIAYRSIVGHMSKQWIETVARDIRDYDEFRQAFLNTFWSSTRQSLVRCNLYQGKYNRNAGLTLSGHFLKFATMASYLDPRPSDVEIIEAIRFHYPMGIQKSMLSSQLRGIGEALDLLKRIEVMESSESFQSPNQQRQPQTQNLGRQNPQSSGPPRGAQNHHQVRQIHYENNRNRYNNNNNWRRNQCQNSRGRSDSPSASGRLNPNAPTFQGQQSQQQPPSEN
jgi:hypothetical protein